MNVDEFSALWAAGADTYDAGQALDPEDWEHFRVLGRRIVDDMVDYLARVRDRPVWRPVPDNVRAAFREPAPPVGRPADRVYEEFRKTILPYPRGNIHPRFWGWVNGSGIPVAAYADFLASVMNCTLGAGENAAMMVEEQTIEWLKEMFAWPGSGSGVLTSGCSMGQIIALAAARQVGASWDIRRDGAMAGPQLRIYASSETHHSVEKAVELLGLGKRSLVLSLLTVSFVLTLPLWRDGFARTAKPGIFQSA